MKKSSTLSSALLLLGAFVVGAVAVNQLLSFARTAEGTHRGGDDPVIVTEQKDKDSTKSDDKTTTSDTKKDDKSDAKKDKKGSGKDSTSSETTKTRKDGKGSGGEEDEESTSQTGDQTGKNSSDGSGTGTTGRGSSGDASGSGEGYSGTGSGGTGTGGSSDAGSGGGGTSGQTIAYPSSSSVYGSGTPQSLSRASERQRRVVNEAKSTRPTQAGYSASWVETVFHNAGIGSFSGNSCDLYDLYCSSSDLSELKVGMIVAVSSHTRSTSGSTWGHVGIYIGDGKVMDCSDGYVRTLELSEWIDYYGTTVPVKWGWIGNVDLT